MSRREVAGSLCWAVAYLAAMQLGRELRFPDETLSVVWPACGVASLWLLGHRGRGVALDLALIALATFTVNCLTGNPPAVAAWFILVNGAQALAGAWLLRRMIPGLWGCDGRLTFDSIGRFSRLLAVATLSSLLAVLVTTAGRGWLLPPATAIDLAVQGGRNVFGFLVVVVVVHLCGHAWRFRDPQRPLVPRGRRWELLALAATTVAIYAAVFGVQATLPLAFLPGAVSIWAGLRFAPAVVGAHSVVAAVLALAGTIAGNGPFAQVADAPVRGMLVQVLMTIIVVSGLSLATVREDTRRLLGELRRGRAAADAQTHLIATIVDTMESGLVVLGPDGVPVRRNRRASQLLAMRPVSDDPGVDQLSTTESWELLWRRVAGALEPAPLDLSLEGPSGVVVVDLRPEPMLDHAGARTGTVVVLGDVTDERASRNQLTRFAGTVAHDLRSPLAGVQGWSHALADELAAAEPDLGIATTMISRVITSAGRMDDLIGDLLTHAVSRDGALDPTVVPIERLAHEVAETLGAEEHLVVRGSVDVLADAGLVRHLLTNLLGNALKYVAPGTVPCIELEAVREEEHAVVWVSDNGIGIPPEHRGRVFDQFHRVREDYPGTGLGLAIARTIVERHGGTIHVQDNPGGGSCFVFTLPAPLRARQPGTVGQAPVAAA